jgi:predicted dienelactone hydrolase
MIDARRPRRWRVRLAAVTTAAAVFTAGAVISAPAVTATAPSKARPPKVAEIGKYAVGVRTETFVDTSRPTDANGAVPAAPTRTLLTAIYYPAQGAPTEKPVANAPPDTKNSPYPIILFSHGIGARGVYYENVIKAWVSAGYVVAAPDYPLSNANTPGGSDFVRGVVDTKNQPADASFVIDQVIKLSKQKGGLDGIVDPKRIGAAGHSLGGITTYGLAFSGCCRDKRIKAAVPMSGIIGVVEGFESYFQGGATPLLAVHGNADPVLPYSIDMNAFARAQPPKYFLTFLGAGHVQPFLSGDDPSAIALKKSTVDFFDRYLKDDKTALEKLRQQANVPGRSTLEEHPESAATAGASTSTTKKSTSLSS